MEFIYHRRNVNYSALELIGYSDSDWAGCRETRRSMSGGVQLDGGALKTWSSRQGSVALSSGEAEHYAAVKAVGELLGVLAAAEYLGWSAKIVLHVDSTGAKGDHILGRYWQNPPLGGSFSMTSSSFPPP